jgi:pyrroline-5-carboxylate reductase
MGEALASGLRAGGWSAENLTVVEVDPARRAMLEAPTVATVADAGPAGGAVIAVKPNDVAGACTALRQAQVRRVLSIAAGVTIAELEHQLGEAAVLRAMPNTPAVVRQAASALSAGTRAGPDDVMWARAILEAIGIVVELPEKALDAVTGLSGSGPAYVFLLAEALIDAGVLVGLARPVARQLAVQTLLGSARLLAETDSEPADLRAGVTSPGGTTAAGLRALEAAGMRAAVLEAVAAATRRATELGGQG